MKIKNKRDIQCYEGWNYQITNIEIGCRQNFDDKNIRKMKNQ